MTIQDRAHLYNNSDFGQQFPDSRFMVSDRWISATWITGNNYKSLSSRSEDDKPFYGSYPPGWLKRMWTMFPDAKRILHLFSGSLSAADAKPPHAHEFALRLDIRAELKPDIVCDAENFAASVKAYAPFDLMPSDPPYSVEDAEHYSTALCNKRKVLDQCHQTLRKGGLLLWMDQSIPMYSKKHWKWVGSISMYRSTNHRIRGVMFFEKV